MYKTSASTILPRNTLAGLPVIDAGISISLLYQTTPFKSFKPWSSQYPGILIIRQSFGVYARSYHFTGALIPLSITRFCLFEKEANAFLASPFTYAVSLFF